MAKKSGFTLIELLIVIGVVAALAGIVFIAVDPAKRMAQARNAVRWSEARSLLDAILLYQVDHNGNLPAGVDDKLRMLGTDASGCDVVCGSEPTTYQFGAAPALAKSILGFYDNDETSFGAGTYNNTQWDSGNSWMELKSGADGVYTSSVKAAGTEADWTNLSWTPQRPTGKELPNNGAAESDYPAGNLDMTGNVLLYHLNESSGLLADSSGQGNNGANVNGALYGSSGKLNTALSFDGTNDYVVSANNSTITGNPNFTISAWVYIPTGAEITGSWAPIVWWGAASTMNSVFFGIHGSEINRWFVGFYNGGLKMTGTFTTNAWHNFIWTRTGGGAANVGSQLYVDGVNVPLANSELLSSNPATPDLAASPYYLQSGGTGRYLQSTIDEVAVWNRALSPLEAADVYLRGALNLLFQVRSCDDSNCSGETFVGPDGTAATYYSELANADYTTPYLNLTNPANNQYFQYQTVWQTANPLYTPELKEVVINYYNLTGEGGGPLTEPACLDLGADLVDRYLKQIPFDQLGGSAAKTYYAVQKTPGGRLKAAACRAERGENIKVQK